MELREQLRELRLAKGLTQMQLGKMLGYRCGKNQACASISYIESGIANVPYKRIPDFAKVLGVPVEVLMQNYVPPKYLKRPYVKYKPTICFSCANAYAHKCLWIALKDPEDGLMAMGITDYVTYDHIDNNQTYRRYSIQKCPNYKAEK